MKTSYIAPCTKTRMIETCYILCVSGNVDPGSGSNEGEDDLGVKRNSVSNSNAVRWENWE